MPRFPEETLDYITDFLHDNPEALRQIRLASRSRDARARMLLFRHVDFKCPRDLNNWSKIFQQGPENFPALHTRSVCFRYTTFTSEDLRWIWSFKHVQRLEIWNLKLGYNSCLLYNFLDPFHKFSPTLKSLTVGWKSARPKEIFRLVHSFPLLEDLHLVAYNHTCRNRDVVTSQPPDLPVFIRTLVLDAVSSWFVGELLKPRKLCRFQRIVWRPVQIGRQSRYSANTVNILVKKCSGTLEFIDVEFGWSCKSYSLAPCLWAIFSI